MRSYTTLAVLGVFLCAVVLLNFGRFRRPASVLRIPLDTVIPAGIDGWTVRDETLGISEAISQSAAKELGFDDYVYRSFSQPGMSFSIFAAHWSAGRGDWHDVASHTPDTCWPASGWTLSKRTLRYVLAMNNTELVPGKWREFKPPNGPITEVVYWHLAGGRVVAYDSADRLSGLREAVRQLLAPKTEQYFIRISSTTAIAELKKNLGFQIAFAGLGNMLRPENFR